MGLSLPHLLVFLGIVILIFGTGKLRNAGKDLGGFIKGFKEGMKDDEKPQPPQELTHQTTDKKDQA